MVEFEGREYIVDDPTTNAYNLLNYVNQYMLDNEVKGKNGEIVQFKINLASPIWLIILGVGYIATVIQKILFAVANAFSINSCSDQQVLNLAQIARIDRKQGAYSTMIMRVTASADGPVTITPADTVTVQYEEEEYIFTPVNEVTIDENETDSVYMIADKIGPVYITSDSITKFDTDIENIAECTNEGSVPGNNLESISTLRTRIQENETVTPIDAAINALNALTGVGRANLYYNPNNNIDVTIAGRTIPPRSAILFVQGDSEEIAEAYYSHMMAPTVMTGSDVVIQSFTAANGQTFDIGYYPPDAKTIYVHLDINQSLPEAQVTAIKAEVAKLSNSLPMGTSYTQSYMLDQLSDSVYFQYIVGLELSLDNVNWYNIAQMDVNNLGIIITDNVSIEVI
jgi:hypothetical protein